MRQVDTVLLTGRLALRRFTAGDAAALLALDGDPANTGSRRVLEKAGLRYLRTVHLDWPDPLPGNELSDVEYELHRSDWQTLNHITPFCPTPPPG